MALEFQVKLKGQDGALDAIITDYDSAYFQRKINNMGSHAIRLWAESSMVPLFTLDSQIEFWWRDTEQGIDWVKEYEGLNRYFRYYTRDEGGIIFEVLGRGYIDLLNRRIINAAAGSAGAAKSGAAETVLKAYVNEQAGPGAGARAISGLSIEANGATGNNVHLKKHYKNLLAICKQIALVGGGDFDVVGTGEGTFEVRWYDGGMGTDRSATISFNLQEGNLEQPSLTTTRLEEINAVLVGGPGEGTARLTTWRTDASLIDDSPWNRVEEFTDANENADLDDLYTAGDAVLAEKAPITKLEFSVLQQGSKLYRRDYFMGDLVTVNFLAFSDAMRIVGVSGTINKDGPHLELMIGDPDPYEFPEEDPDDSATGGGGGGGGGETGERPVSLWERIGANAEIRPKQHGDDVIIADSGAGEKARIVGATGNIILADAATTKFGAYTMTWPTTGVATGEYLKATVAGSAITLSWEDPLGGHSPHDPVTLSLNLDSALLSLTDQELGLNVQAATMFFAGPVSGGMAAPGFRYILSTDLAPNPDVNYILFCSGIGALAWGSPADIAGVLDHGTLLGLGDDDHAQYLNAARHEVLTANLHYAKAVTQDDAPASFEGMIWLDTDEEAPAVTLLGDMWFML